MFTIQGAPRLRKAYIRCGAGWFRKGIFGGNAITTPVPYSLQHDTFGVGGPEPRQPACVVVTLYTCYRF
jgi:hypothetical protein